MQIIDCQKPYRLVKARHGWFLANTQDEYIGCALLTYGEYGEIEWQMLEQLIRPGRDAIEVGANIGSHTVPMARRLAGFGRRMLAVEPQPIIFQNMCANISLNALFNVTAENVACSDKTGRLSFDAPDYRQQDNFGNVTMREDELGSQRVRMMRLDDLVAGDFDVGLIKIDVEGFEQKVIEGASKTIARYRPLIYVENDRFDQSQALIECLWAAGYQMCWHLPALFNPGNFAQDGKNIYLNVVSANMVALPNEAVGNVTGFVAITDANAHPMKRAI